MEIVVAKSAGFCYGVKKAIEKANKPKINNKEVYTLGDIIHNKNVVEKLERKGIYSVENIYDIPNNSNVIIRAHGIPKEYYKILEKKNISIIDATCTFVDKIHKLVEKNYNQGKKIIIIGEEKHPEIIGINGWCNNEAIIINSIDKNPTFDQSMQYYCVSQTTFSIEKYEKIIKYLKNNINIFEFNNTICYTTKERQKEVEFLSKNSDTMLVIGDKKSSNTMKLLDVAKKHCSNTYLITSVVDIKKIKNIKKIKKLGITAGASTPKELIEEVKKAMADSQNQSVFEQALENSEKEINNINDRRILNKNLEMKVISFNEKDSVYILSIHEEGKYNFEISMPIEETYFEDSKEDIKLGDLIKVTILKKDGIIASRKAYLQKQKSKELFKSIYDGMPFDLKIKEVIKGAAGLQGELYGCTVFIPNSHVALNPLNPDKLKKYIGKTIKVKYLPDLDKDNKEKKPSRRNMKASRKLLLEEEKLEKDKLFWEKHEIGDVVKGRVVKVLDFGAFVEVDGKDCLVPISKLAWYKINSVKDILKNDTIYDFIIDESSSKEKGKVVLSYKDLQLKPEDIISVKYLQGTVIKGKIVKITDKAMFVNLEPGIDGRVSISEISNKFINNINDLYKEGDEVEAVVVDNAENKIKLSIRVLLNEKENSDTQDNNQEKKEKKQNTKKKEKKEEVHNFNDESEGVTLGGILEDLLK